jgi:hypothetical protein
MGLLILRYITAEGFDVSGLYVQVESIRILKTFNGSSYGCSFTSSAWKSPEDKSAGARPIPIPFYLANAEVFLTADQFYDQTIFGYAYSALKANWVNAGYQVEDYYPHPPTPTTFIYDCSGYNFRGFNCAGYDREGYGRDGFNKEGYDREGYDREGYNKEGYDRQGFNKEGYDHEGYDREGFNKEGYDREGFNKEGYDREGYDREGYDQQGCNREHKDREGNECTSSA